MFSKSTRSLWAPSMDESLEPVFSVIVGDSLWLAPNSTFSGSGRASTVGADSAERIVGTFSLALLSKYSSAEVLCIGTLENDVGMRVEVFEEVCALKSSKRFGSLLSEILNGPEIEFQYKRLRNCINIRINI